MIDYEEYINALRKCANEHDNDTTYTGHIIVSNLCRDTANLLESLEQEPDKRVITTIKRIDLPTVGEILKEEFMDPYGISAYRLAKDIFVPVSRIQSILNGTRKITVDTSIRLGKYFGVSYDYFLNIQNDIDIRRASEDMFDEINKIKQIMTDKEGVIK